MKKAISETQTQCLCAAMQYGALVRYVGGFWSYDGVKRDHNGNPVYFFGASTVDGLVKRGRLEYTTWQEGRKGKFPIGAKIKEPS